MSNIERKYAYYDEGVLPEEGEYGVTYLTLYSSSAGNIYDGWIYDPDNKIPVSVTERTFGYRHPEFSQYCWDDEVVVDLSNPQSREESDFTQGRIVSFNTNVSPYPIILQDVDISEMTESEREAHATTVLFTAIPLISDAYIQAQVEVQCKCNLSPDNTSGEMRIEAFYILNDESDRTMRPNPVHTFIVSSANERHTLPWLYFNPALRHEDNNYIGVKLICTGGTAEIGISDVREYGDAIITLTSAGLTGDKIFGGRPVSLDIFGLDEVISGYKLNPDDYTVLCTYDTGEIYDVTRLCDFNPSMGTEVNSEILLTAYYQDLQDSMLVSIGIIERIELSGVQDYYGSYTLKKSNYTVLGYLTNGDVVEITDYCSFSPTMGSILSTDITLTASYVDPVSGTVFTDSIDISCYSETMSYSPNNGLIYTLYSDDYVIITGDSHIQLNDGVEANEIIELPSGIKSYFSSNRIPSYVLRWEASGAVGGFILQGTRMTTTGNPIYGSIRSMLNFDKVKIRPYYSKVPYPKPSSFKDGYNPIVINFSNNPTLTSDQLNFIDENIELIKLYNLDNITSSSRPSTTGSSNANHPAFAYCSSLTHINFTRKLPMSHSMTIDSLVLGCSSLTDISAIEEWGDLLQVTTSGMACKDCIALKDLSPFTKISLANVTDAQEMFSGTGITDLTSLSGFDLGANHVGSMIRSGNLFSYCEHLVNLQGMPEALNGTGINNPVGMFRNCGLKTLNGINGLQIQFISTNNMFRQCVDLEDINAIIGLNPSLVRSAEGMFYGDRNIKDFGVFSSWIAPQCTNYKSMFYAMGTAYDREARGANLINWQNVEINYCGNTSGVKFSFSSVGGGAIYNQYVTNGMFAGRDCFYKDTNTGIVYFEYPDSLPEFYKNFILSSV